MRSGWLDLFLSFVWALVWAGNCLLIPSWVQAEEVRPAWRHSFEHLEKLGLQQQRVLVICGSRDRESQVATTALARALEKEGVELVVPSPEKEIEQAAGQADSEILSRTQENPADVWIISRVFANKTSTLVFSLYDRKRELIHAYSVKKGQKLFPGVGVEGISDETVASVVHVSDSTKEALNEYERRYLWIGTRLTVSPYGSSEYDTVYMGRHKKKISRKELHRLLKSEALDAEIWDATVVSIVSTFLLATASAVVAGVSGFGLYLFVNHSYRPDNRYAACALFVGEWVGLLIGAGLLVTSPMPWVSVALDDPEVLKGHKLRQHVEQYNKKLQGELGLQDVEGLPRGYSAPAGSHGVAPFGGHSLRGAVAW